MQGMAELEIKENLGENESRGFFILKKVRELWRASLH